MTLWFVIRIRGCFSHQNSPVQQIFVSMITQRIQSPTNRQRTMNLSCDVGWMALYPDKNKHSRIRRYSGIACKHKLNIDPANAHRILLYHLHNFRIQSVRPWNAPVITSLSVRVTAFRTLDRKGHLETSAGKAEVSRTSACVSYKTPCTA